MRRLHRILCLLAWVLTASDLSAQGAIGAAGGPRPNLAGELDRPLRYTPDGTDFVIVNGAEFFNRPLYGGHTAFRVDAGDRPEFSLYLPGRGGNLRLGIKATGGTRWLFEAERVVARYRPGSMLYEIGDPLLGPEGTLDVTLLAMNATEGLIVRAEARGLSGAVELVWAYGGINGQRGVRDGDIGTERVPISQYFQLQPELCRDNAVTLDGSRFVLSGRPATIVGLVPADAQLAVADARAWGAGWEALQASTGTVAPELPLVVGRAPLVSGQPLLLALQRVADGAVASEELATYRDVTAPRPGASGTGERARLLPPYAVTDLPRVAAESEAYFRALREHVAVDTPDPFINAAVAALNVGADAVWDESQGAVMHGAIAWRSRLLGWRGPYAMDALGWHDRARQHLAYWAKRQNADPIPDRLPAPAEATNLARNPDALHSNGDLSNSHYDMNLVYIDALFRHLLWTGDIELARDLWPVIERHLAWERRLFRRELGAEKLPLYEAYAAIWASDDLGYNGGGVAYTSAYSWWHNTMAARLARLLGKDGALYEREADAIARAMRQQLWLPEQGMFAEYRDLLGLQRAHPSAGLWSFYHVLDAPGLVDAREAWRMTRYVDAQLPHLPVRGPGVPTDHDYQVLATTNWMPYTWSANNVVMGENVHTALGFWQTGRADEAFRLLKSALLASMFMGICPGNVGSMNYLDVYRRESQRDFADGSGVTSRAIVEGLFGIHPDALAGELRIAPGFPAGWERASIRTPTMSVAFAREGSRAHYAIESRLPHVRRALLRLPAWRATVRAVKINGRRMPARVENDMLGRRWLEVAWDLADRNDIVVEWSGPRVVASVDQIDGVIARGRASMPVGSVGVSPQSQAQLAAVEVRGELQAIALAAHFNDRVTDIFRPGKYRSPRSPYVSLALPAQGIGAWAGHVNASAEIDDAGLRRAAAEHDGRFVLPSGVFFATPGPGDTPNVLFTSLWDNYPDEATVPLRGRARHVHLLMAGTTNHMQSRFDNGEVIVTYTDGSTARLALHNPTNWWPIDQDYFIDDYQFRRAEPIPPRVSLKTGEVRLLDVADFKGKGGVVPGGAATVLGLALDPEKELRSLTVRALANEVVIGLMAATLER
jgi:hypothetical protein